MHIKALRSVTITTLMKRLFSPTDPCQFKARFPRRVAKVQRVVEAHHFRVQRTPVVKEEICGKVAQEAWPYDTALPSGLPRIAEMPASRPDLESHRPPLPAERPLLSDKHVDVLI